MRADAKFSQRDTRGPRKTRRNVLVGAIGAIAGATILGTPILGTHRAFQAAAADRGLATRTRAGTAFQTPVALTIAGPDAAALEQAIDAAFVGLREVEAASSVYHADSALMRLNREGHIDRPPPHLVILMRHALDLAAATDGAFDPTVQPLWDLWSEYHARGARPDDAALRETLRRVDWRGVTVTTNAISFDRPGMAVTLNSINQGHAADVVMAILSAHGIEHAFVDTGEFGATGRHPSGRDWRLGVAAPRDPETLAYTIDPFRRFSATSGDYKTFFSPDFRDHHIFDPKTGRSPPDWSSITVAAPSGLMADGLSTALFTLDQVGAQALLAARPGCDARFFDKQGAERRLVA